MNFIMISTVLSMCFNFANISGDNNKTIATRSDAKVSNVEVYKSQIIDQTPKYEYRMSYDDQHRVVNKETYRWNDEYSEWEHYCAKTYEYSENSYTVNVSYWNNKKQVYDQPEYKSVYKTENGNVVSVANYRLDKKTSDYVLTDKSSFSNPQ